jgi:electron transport complex protein RnfB
MAENTKKSLTRQEFLDYCGRGLLIFGLGGIAGKLGARKARGETVWQIDPTRCTQCGQCATHCVLDQSAVKCFHNYVICGYCDLCTGYFGADPIELHEGAENQICPVNALKRRYVDEPYFEYTIDEDRCIGCARCVDGCTRHGNGSLYLQVRHDICTNCNQCSIAAACPSDAYVRVPADNPYISR